MRFFYKRPGIPSRSEATGHDDGVAQSIPLE